jgi:hypothetical protein
MVPLHCRWDEALAAYEGKLCVTQPSSQEYLTALLGKMRCLASLAEWEKLSTLCRWVVVRVWGGGGRRGGGAVGTGLKRVRMAGACATRMSREWVWTERG